MTTEKPPVGYEDDLSAYGPVVFDGVCGKPIGWGFKIVRRLGGERFKSLAKHGDLVCIEFGVWCLVTKKLTPVEAVAEYGKVTKLEVGKFGGFRFVMYGDTKFRNKWLDPRGVEALVLNLAESGVVVTAPSPPPRPRKKKDRP